MLIIIYLIFKKAAYNYNTFNFGLVGLYKTHNATVASKSVNGNTEPYATPEFFKRKNSEISINSGGIMFVI